MGTQDLNHQFKPIAFALTRTEKQSDYAFLLNSVKFQLQEIFNYDWKIDLALTDASSQILNALREIFGPNFTNGMCWVHCFRNADKKIASLVEKDFRKDLRKDIRFLETIHEKTLFDNAFDLLKKKWEDDASDFLEYFKKEWIQSDFQNWYRGSIPPGFSNTNNSIEGFNFGIKKKYTNWNRFKISDFIEILKEIISDYSLQSSNSYPNSYQITPDLWQKAQTTKSDPFLIEGTKVFYWKRLGDSTKRQKVTAQGLSKYKNIHKSKTFEAFIEGFNLWETTIGNDINTTTCTCPQFRLHHVCKHLLAALVILQKISIPDEYSSVEIVEEKKKRGRNKKAGNAYQRDEN